MSKKLIAVASAAALALTALVGVAPANAATMSVVGTVTGTGSAADPYDINVPDDNIISTANQHALELTLTSLAVGDVVTVTTTGAVKVTQASLTVASRDLDNTTVGKSALTSTRTNTDAINWLLYTTSDVTGTAVVTVTRTGLTTTNTYHIKGIAGVGYKLGALSGVPSTLASGSAVVSFKVTDVFGNAVDSDFTNPVTAGVIGTTGTAIDTTYDAALAAHKFTLTSSSADPSFLKVDLGASSVNGFASKTDEVVAYFNTTAASATNTQITSLTAQIASLTEQLANSRPKATSVTKKRFNTLARKWNAAFPSQKVALK
jgi:hypothetical protein